MKKRIPEPVSNVEDSSNLEALARAYIQAATNRKMTQTEAVELITKIWRNDITIAEIKKRVEESGCLQDTEECKEFRSKVERMIKEFPNLAAYYRKDYNKAERERYAIEMICGIYKYFEKTDSIRSNELICFLRDYLIVVLDEFTTLTASPAIQNRMDHTFNKLRQISFCTTKGPDDLYEKPDLSVRPFDPENPGVMHFHGSILPLELVSEGRELMREYDVRDTKLTRMIFDLLWFVETFF